MRPRGEASRLRTIAKIRDVQRMVAEADAGHAAASLRTKIDAVRQAEAVCGSSQEQWRIAVEGPAIRLDIMPLWSAHMAEDRDALRRASADADAADIAVKRCATAWRAAIAKRDAVDALAHEAAKNERRRREEADLQDAADRYALGRKLR